MTIVVLVFVHSGLYEFSALSSVAPRPAHCVFLVKNISFFLTNKAVERILQRITNSQITRGDQRETAVNFTCEYLTY